MAEKIAEDSSPEAVFRPLFNFHHYRVAFRQMMKITHRAKIRCDEKNTQFKIGASLASVLLLCDFQ